MSTYSIQTTTNGFNRIRVNNSKWMLMNSLVEVTWGDPLVSLVLNRRNGQQLSYDIDLTRDEVTFNGVVFVGTALDLFNQLNVIVTSASVGSGGGGGGGSFNGQLTQGGTNVSSGNPLPVSTVGAATEVTLAALNAKIPPAGQTTMAASQPVTIASNQSAVPVSVPASTNAIGDVGVQYRANATGAADRTQLVSAATTNATVVKASAGRLLGYVITNTNASFRYVKFHNQTTTPTAGASIFLSIGIPPNTTVSFTLEGGVAFSTGIGITTVTGAANTDTAAVGANDLVINLMWR
jgi:hypothetical protein